MCQTFQNCEFNLNQIISHYVYQYPNYIGA
jgi:hypothetical protein